MAEDEDVLTKSVDQLPEGEQKKQVKEEPEITQAGKEEHKEEKKEADTEREEETATIAKSNSDEKTKDIIKDAIKRSSIAASTTTTLPKEVATLNAVTIVHNAESTYAAASAVLQTDVDDKRTITETEVTLADPKKSPVPIQAAFHNSDVSTMPPPMYDEGAPNMDDKAAWMAMFEELKTAYNNHGKKGKEETDLVKLGRLALWVSRQRMYRHKLPRKQEQMLETLAKPSALLKIKLDKSERDAIAWNSEQGRTKSSRVTASSSNSATQTNFTEHFDWGKQNLGGNHLRWQQMWTKLVEFKRSHGHVKVPIRWPTNPTLGKWVSRQRDTAAVLSHERSFKLNQLGFVWQCGNNTIHSRKEAEDRARLMAEEQAKKGKDVDPDAVFEVLMEQERKRLQKKQMTVTKHRVKRIKIQQQNLRDYKRGIKTPPPSHSLWKNNKAKYATPPPPPSSQQEQQEQQNKKELAKLNFHEQQLFQIKVQQYLDQQELKEMEYEQKQKIIDQQQQQRVPLTSSDARQQALLEQSEAWMRPQNNFVDSSNAELRMPQNNNNSINGNYDGNNNTMIIGNNTAQVYYDPSYQNGGNNAQNNIGVGDYHYAYDDASISSTDTDDSYHYSDNFFHVRYQRKLDQKPNHRQQQQQCPLTPTRGTSGSDPAATPLINNLQPQERSEKRSSTRRYGGYSASDPFSPSPTKVHKVDSDEIDKPVMMQSLTENFHQEHDHFGNAKESVAVTPHSVSPGSLSPVRQQLSPVPCPHLEAHVLPTPRKSETKLTIQMQPGSAIFSPTEATSQDNKKRKQSPVSQEEESRSFAMACCRRLNKSEEDWKRKQQWTFVCK